MLGNNTMATYGGDFNGDGGGNGFFVGGPSQSSPAGGGGGEGGKYKPHFVTPVTIRQVKTATTADDQSFQVNGKEVNHISLVAVVRSFDVKQTKFVCTVEDHTGVIDLTHWSNPEDEDNMAASVRDNMYVRCVGQIKDIGKNRAINAFRIVPLQDYNELTMHLMDVIYTHLVITRGNKDAPQPVQRGFGMDVMGGGGRLVPPTAGGHAAIETYGGGGQHRMSHASNGLSDAQNTVLDMIKQHAGEVGMPLDQLLSVLRTRMDEANIRKTIDFLSNEGHIYSTIDDNHFRATDA